MCSDGKAVCSRLGSLVIPVPSLIPPDLTHHPPNKTTRPLRSPEPFVFMELYQKAVPFFSTLIEPGPEYQTSEPLSLSQAKSCICHMCGAHLSRLHSCLHCVFFGCFTKKHIHEHAKTKRHNLGKRSAPHTNRERSCTQDVSFPNTSNTAKRRIPHEQHEPNTVHRHRH